MQRVFVGTSKGWLGILTLAACSVLVACGKGSFSGSSPQAISKSNPAQPNEADGLSSPSDEAKPDVPVTPPDNADSVSDAARIQLKPTEVMTIPVVKENSVVAPLDIVWVIDNSRSMDNEAAKVQQNFQKFIDSVSERNDLKLALISTNSGATGVTLPEAAKQKGHIQINNKVGSNDALMRLAAATCPKNMTTAQSDKTQGKVCGQSVSNVASDVAAISSTLANFYRPNARKVFVIVTDDNAEDVTSSNFMAMVSPHLNNDNRTMYSFVGKSNVKTTACEIAAIGTAYETLATQTKGETFDLCQSDWTPHFTKLASIINAAALFQMNADLSKVAVIEELHIDGTLVAKELYSIVDGKLNFSASVDLKHGQTVTIKYVAKTE